MSSPVAAIRNLQWGHWLRGLIGAGISAIGGAIGSSVGAASIPQVAAINGAVFHVAWVTAGVAAIVSMGKYLATNPLPDPVIVQTEHTETNVSGGTVTMDKTTETKTLTPPLPKA